MPSSLLRVDNLGCSKRSSDVPELTPEESDDYATPTENRPESEKPGRNKHLFSHCFEQK